MQNAKRMPALIIHAGAGAISDSRIPLKTTIMIKAIKAAYKTLMENDNPLDAVEEAVKVMEDDESCNAGRGSVLTSEGDVEMDAIIIRGSDLRTGAVGAVKHVKNAISLARKVMDTNHCLLVGNGAEEYAKSVGIPLIPSSDLITPAAKDALQRVLGKIDAPSTEFSDKIGTVGAVAINSRGEIAAATSTGGLIGKLPGRVGDTPIVGGGTFCDDNMCGISATGMGEAIMRVSLASRIAIDIERGMNVSQACIKSLNYMTEKIPEGDGGAIVITKDGTIGYNFNSRNLAWAYTNGQDIHYGCKKGDDMIEELSL